MSSKHNRIRKKWQDYSGRNAAAAEMNVFDSFQVAFEKSDYSIIRRPNIFRNIYVSVELSEKEKSKIYTPPKPITKHGLLLDYTIQNKASGRQIFIEVKRQDGWVEGKERKAGRGNAHERSCKFFTPGLLKILRAESKIPEPSLPFWTIFQGDITRDPCRVREITCWYDTFSAHYFFWRDAPNPDSLFRHFENRIAPLLD